MDLFVFTTDPPLAAALDRAGAAGVIVDWERRGKARRQCGEGTQINHDTADDLRAVRAATGARVLCRVNGAGAWTRREIELAADLGADEVLLPMVRTPADVELALEAAAGRVGLGILVETRAAVACAASLAALPLSRVYVGLNDLRIDRGSTQLFEPLVDGTADAVRASTGSIAFGIAGLTLPDHGYPVPSALLAGELARLDASFTFLRRSFHADVRGRDLGASVRAISAHCALMRARPGEQVDADRAALRGALAAPAVSA